ncbi:unnamed protein product [Zymoseptoria tritici ST99CH_1A5]|uniref:Uncharacterized protein n=1 Tax=Zymoseptoria tritici ST99CH_1A5 TaxID=1276529 RepID=A0A1Y6LL87_ZYMTR|nr:unnamed protein product [Zymoseptoria tritici ST99CH_1A5]
MMKEKNKDRPPQSPKATAARTTKTKAKAAPKPKAKKARDKDEPAARVRHDAAASGSRAAALLKKSKDSIDWLEKPLPKLLAGQITRVPHPDEMDAQLFTDDFDDIDKRSYSLNKIRDMRQALKRQLNSIFARESEIRTSIALNRDYPPPPMIPRKLRANEALTAIGTPTARFKFSKIAADLVIPRQVNMLTDWNKARSDKLELVKDYFELTDIDNKAIPWPKPPENLKGAALEKWKSAQDAEKEANKAQYSADPAPNTMKPRTEGDDTRWKFVMQMRGDL